MGWMYRYLMCSLNSRLDLVASKALDGGGLWLDERYDAAVDVQIPLALMWALYASDLHLCDCMLRAPEGLEDANLFVALVWLAMELRRTQSMTVW
jgi:hypothetical protein